jgi:ribonuclease HII
VPKGDQVAACVAAASVLAKVTRDRIMVALDAEFPEYGFAEHKGYCTPVHDEAMLAHGPSRVHRYSFVNVRAARDGVRPPVVALDEDAMDEDAMDDIVDDTIEEGLAEDLAEGLVHNGTLAVGTSEGAGGGVEP